MIDATAAAMPVHATQARLSLSFPAFVGEKDAALLPVASCGRHGPAAQDAAATAFEDKVLITYHKFLSFPLFFFFPCSFSFCFLFFFLFSLFFFCVNMTSILICWT